MAATGKSTKSPAFQFYAKDFLASAKVQRMSLAQIGAYIKLLALAWLDDGLPTEPKDLARMLGVTVAAFRALWGGALGECFEVVDGRYRNLKLEDVRQQQADYRAKQTANITARWNKSGIDVVSPSNIPKAYSASASASATTTKNEEHTPRARGLSAGVQAGTTQKEHLKHAFCGQTYRVCVPEFLHGELVRRLGGDDADARIRGWYATTEAGLDPAVPVAEAVKFWRAAFESFFAPIVVKAPSRHTVPRYTEWTCPHKGAEHKGAIMEACSNREMCENRRILGRAEVTA